MTKIKLAILDLDGTLVNKDTLDLLCRAAGKEKESEQLNAAFHRGEKPGLSALIERINFLKGMSRQQIADTLAEDKYLLPGVEELFGYFKQNKIVTILASGGIIPVLEYYQGLLGIDHVVGSRPNMDGDIIMGIDESAYPTDKHFKVAGIEQVLEQYDFTTEEIMAMGDSPSDKGMFAMSGLKIAINPKGDIAEYADHVVRDDVSKVIELIEKYSA